jgi:hypothetical protein
VPLQIVQADPFQHLGVWLKVRSEPNDATVYLNWAPKGKTPLWLNGVTVSGLLVVAKDGYQAWFREIDYRENGELPLTLVTEPSYASRRLLLVSAGATSPDALDQLRTKLADAGFSIPGIEDTRVFEQAERDAGGLANISLCAWARARFDTRMLIKARVREEQRDLATQSPVLSGTVRVVVNADLDVYDLDKGKHVTLISATGSAFALDRPRAFDQAMTKIAHDAAEKLKSWLAQ